MHSPYISEHLNFDFVKNPFWRGDSILDTSSMLDDIDGFIRWWRDLPDIRRAQIGESSLPDEFKIHFAHLVCIEENEGVQTVGETRQIYRRLSEKGDDEENRPPVDAGKITGNLFRVLQSMEKLASEARSDGEVFFVTIDMLNEWHKELWSGISVADIASPGHPRPFSSYPIGSDDGHTYPESAEVLASFQTFVDIFCEIASEFQEKSSIFDNGVVRNSLIIKWAAWSMFMFVSLHPYSDGNGRISRLLCNYVLSSIFPMPIPVYNVFSPTTRETYLQAIKLDRSCPCRVGASCDNFDRIIYGPKPCLIATMVLECCWYSCHYFKKYVDASLVSISIAHPLPWPYSSPKKLERAAALERD